MKKRILITCLLLCTLHLCGYSYGMPKSGDILTPDEYLIQYLEALKTGDENAAFRLWMYEDTPKNREEFSEFFLEQKKHWGNRDNYTYVKTEEKGIPADDNRPEGMEYTYKVNCKDRKFTIRFSTVEDYKGRSGIDAFSIRFVPGVTGNLKTFRQFNGIQWFLVFVSAAEVFFTLWMAWRCIKNRPKRWILWLIFILVFYGGVTIETINGTKVGVFVYTLQMPQLLIYPEIGIYLYLSAPVGAIAYYLKKKGDTKMPSEG